MQQIWAKLGEPEWWFSTVIVSIACNLVAAAIFAFALEKMKANTGPLSPTPQRLTVVRTARSGFLIVAFIFFCVAVLLSIWPAPTQVRGTDPTKSSDQTQPFDQPQFSRKTQPPDQPQAVRGAAPLADNGTAPVQSVPECPTPQSPSTPLNQRTAKQLYCSVLPCYAGNAELDQNVALLGEWIRLTELSLNSCNASDRKLLTADAVLAKLSLLPDSKIGTYDDRIYCSNVRFSILGKIEETMNRLQVLPPKCANKVEEASAPVVTFMQKIRR